MIFLKMDRVKKGVENFYLSSGTNKSISNFREPINLNHEPSSDDSRKTACTKCRQAGFSHASVVDSKYFSSLL
jgi:hypothetical protein